MSKNIDLIRPIAPDIPFTVWIVVVAPVVLVAVSRVFDVSWIADKMSSYAFERKAKETTRSEIIVYCYEFPADVIVASRAHDHLPRVSREPAEKNVVIYLSTAILNSLFSDS